MQDKEIEPEGFFLSEHEPGIQFVVCKNMVITKELYEELLNAIVQLRGNKKAGLIVDMRSIKMVTYNGGQYARKAFSKCFLGAAMIAQTSVARMVFSYFVNVMKPEFPMKAFADAETPKHWLMQLKK